MRINVYDKELTTDVKVIAKLVAGVTYTGIRFFMNDPNGDPDTKSAVTFWGKGDLRPLLQNGIDALDKFYQPAEPGA